MPTDELPLKSFHFDCGNSNTGPVGFCARVKARTKEEALEKLKAALPEEVALRTVCNDEGMKGIEYLNVYFNDVNIHVGDIDDEEDTSDGEDEEP